MMTADELYEILDKAGIDFEIVEIFEGARFIRVVVDDEKPSDDTYDEYGVNTKNSFNTPPRGAI